MKNFFPLLLLVGVMYLSSCGNGANDPLPVAVPADSTTTGSYLTTWFLGDAFVINDLALNGVSKIQLHASDIYNATDSVWVCRVQLIDVFKDKMEMNITAQGSLSTGAFTVVDNTSTLTDYTHGQNKVYSVAPGSIINVTQSFYPIKGTMDLTLYYNHTTTYSTSATDSFKISQ